MNKWHRYIYSWQDIENYPDAEAGEGQGGFRNLTVYPDRDTGAITVSYSGRRHLPLGGDWMTVLQDTTVRPALVAAQMLAAALDPFPIMPAGVRAHMFDSLVAWTSDYRERWPGADDWD